MKGLRVCRRTPGLSAIGGSAFMWRQGHWVWAAVLVVTGGMWAVDVRSNDAQTANPAASPSRPERGKAVATAERQFPGLNRGMPQPRVAPLPLNGPATQD